jgi:N-acetylneuraminate synthase
MQSKIIAEVGSNHNGDLSRAKKLIHEYAKAGCYAVKFQMFKAEKLYAPELLKPELKERELPVEWLPELRSCCDENNVEFGMSVFDLDSLNAVVGYVDFLKISSFDTRRKDLVQACLSTGKQLMFSFGLTPENEIFDIVRLAIDFGYNHEKLVFMHCVSKYPAGIESACVSRVSELKDAFCHISKIGYSDHTANFYAVLASVINGAEYIELHVDLDDMAGAESEHGHVWDLEDVISLTGMLKEVSRANDKKFELAAEDMRRRANPETGLREFL